MELLENKHKKYQDFKNYLMQQIFTQKLRFDETGEWKTYTLKELGETYNGLSSLSKENFEEGTSQYITYKSIFDNNILESNFTEPVELNNKSQNNVKKGDLFFTGSSETPEKVGMVSVLNSDIENCYLNSFCFGFRLNNFISKKEILKLKIEIPSTVEQEKIVELFINVDNKTKNILNELSNINEFKKCLLQQMFI